MVFPLGDLAKTRTVPVVTYALIALNVLMYCFQLARGDTFTTALAATPYELSQNYDLSLPRDEALLRLPGLDEPLPQARVPFPVRLTVLTALFLHSDPFHLAINMLFLWIFGDNVEEVLGRIGYLAAYLFCGLTGTLAQTLASPNSIIPTLGASGAIAGVMGAYVVWFPRNRVRILMLRYVIEMPAIVAIGAWFAFQLWRGVGTIRHPVDAGGVAYLAHVGGAASGILIAILFRKLARAIILRELEWESSADR